MITTRLNNRNSKIINSKILLVLALFFSVLTSFSQEWDTKTRKYENGVVLMGLIDVSKNKVETLKQEGKNVIIKYDPFFIKYTINFEGENGSRQMIFLDTKIEEKGIKIFIDDYSLNKDQFVVINRLEKENKLIVTMIKPIVLNGKTFKLFFLFEDFN
jgi:hypothetical protein